MLNQHVYNEQRRPGYYMREYRMLTGKMKRSQIDEAIKRTTLKMSDTGPIELKDISTEMLASIRLTSSPTP
jgi:hypothetical protein